MITVNLMGGLGNQLFQYAFGRSLERDTNVAGRAVRWDPSHLDNDRGRAYLLDTLGLDLPLVRGGPGEVIYEGSLRWKPETMLIRKTCVLHGYWQCENYFARDREYILGEVFRGMTRSTTTEAVAARIRSCESSAFLHVRRTDNLSPASRAFHGLLDRDYYHAAADHVRARVPSVRFFVFSDDPAWCRVNMVAPDTEIVDHNPMALTCDEYGTTLKRSGGRECEDLWLMSLCRHGIVANSTFSWWGAWLSPRETVAERVVVAPRAWFVAPHMRGEDRDVIPARWKRL